MTELPNFTELTEFFYEKTTEGRAMELRTRGKEFFDRINKINRIGRQTDF
jgi:hypothetical protein